MVYLPATLRLLLPAALVLALSAPLVGALGVPGLRVEADAPIMHIEAETAASSTPLEHALVLDTLPQFPLVPELKQEGAAPLPIGTQLPSSVGRVPNHPPLGRAPIGPESAAPPAPSPEAAAAAGATLLWVIFERFGLGRGLAALYSRLAPSSLLENERRERALSMVRERPGIGPQDIATALGTGWGVTIYHLDKLERAGLVTSRREGHHRCYFLPGSVPRDEQKTVALFRGDTTRRVAQFVTEKPGLTQSQVASELGLSASAMSKQVARLEAADVLRREPTLGGQRLFPATALS